MSPSQKISKEKSSEPKNIFDEKIAAANRVLTLLGDLPNLDEEQLALLASAHYVLAEQPDLSINRTKMHINSAITLSQNITNKDMDLYLQLAYAYSRRAEIFELENAFTAAITDYQRALDIFDQQCFNEQFKAENSENSENSEIEFHEDDIMHMAHCAITIADLLINEEINCDQLEQLQLKETHPLYYVNIALDYLSNFPKANEDLWSTLAYVHSVAGSALRSIDIHKSIDAYRIALTMAFKTEPSTSCLILADTYNQLASIYEQFNCVNHIQKIEHGVEDHSLIYYCISSLFNPGELEDQEDNNLIINNLYGAVFRAMDPYLPPLSQIVIRDLIDALVFGYYCIADGLLPNQSLCEKLQQPEIYSIYAQHIYWLVVDLFYSDHPNCRLLELADPNLVDLNLDIHDILESILRSSQQNSYSNVFHLPKPLKTSSSSSKVPV